MRYDTLGRKNYMHDPDMGVWGYTYDANGNLETQTDARGLVITFGYDELNRLITKQNGASLVVTNIYDETTSSNSKGRLSRMVDGSGQTTYNYDNMGRATSVVKSIDGTAYNLGFTFLNGRLGSITYPDSEVVNYSYDAGELKGVTGYVGYSNFDAMGRPLNAAFGAGGASSLFTYYPDTQRLHTLSVVSPNNGLLIDNSYTYDNKGNVSSITDNLNKPMPTDFSSESYILDANRAHAVGSTGNGRTFQYDANGNITNDGQRGISYNYDNMPTAVNNVSFAYDGNATRIKKSSAAGTTVYLGKLYECTNGTCTKYIFAGNTRIAKKVGAQVSFFHPDHQGGTSVITDAAGNKVEEISYYPFGGTRQDSNSTSDSHKYTDQELDGETGLYNYNARLYDPEMGRFLTADSIVPDPSNPQSLNRYSYVINNPMNYTDPTGHSFRNGWKRAKAWFREHGDTDAGAAVSFSGSFGPGNINATLSAGPASGTPVNTVSGTNSPSAANVNTANGISINIYNNGEFVGVNSIYSQLSNSFGNYYGNAQLSLGYGGIEGGGSMNSADGFGGGQNIIKSADYRLSNAVNVPNTLSAISYVAGTAAGVAVVGGASPAIIGGLALTAGVAVAANFGISYMKYNSNPPQISFNQYRADGIMSALSLTSLVLPPVVGLYIRPFDIGYSVYNGATSIPTH